MRGKDTSYIGGMELFSRDANDIDILKYWLHMYWAGVFRMAGGRNSKLIENSMHNCINSKNLNRPYRQGNVLDKYSYGVMRARG